MVHEGEALEAQAERRRTIDQRRGRCSSASLNQSARAGNAQGVASKIAVIRSEAQDRGQPSAQARSGSPLGEKAPERAVEIPHLDQRPASASAG